MIRRVFAFATLALIAMFMNPAQAGAISYTGSLDDPDQVFFLEITVTTPSTLSIQGFGYGGGINGSGSSISAGGFDMVIALFEGAGASATLIDSNDDGICPPGSFDPVTGGCLDSTLYRELALPSIYTIALSASFNAPVGATLGDGFTGGGSFIDVFGDSRTNSFSFDVTTNSLQAIPEPSVITLFSIALLLAGNFGAFFRRARRK